MTPQSRGKTAKTAVFRHRWQAWQVVRSIAAVRQRPRTPRNWRCSFTFFESFLWHFNEKQRGEVVFRHSRPVSCKNQENGAGKQWSVHAPLKQYTKLKKIKLLADALSHVHLNCLQLKPKVLNLIAEFPPPPPPPRLAQLSFLLPKNVCRCYVYRKVWYKSRGFCAIFNFLV